MSEINLDTAGVLNITAVRRASFDLTIGLYATDSIDDPIDLTGQTVQLDIRDTEHKVIYSFGGIGGLGTVEIIDGKVRFSCDQLLAAVGTHNYDIFVKDGETRTRPVKGVFIVAQNSTEMA